MPEDIHQRVLQAFQEEHREHVAGLRSFLERWPDLSPDAVNEMFRLAHSMKGGARVCDLGTIEKIGHYLEQLFAALRRGEHPRPDALQSIRDALAAIEDYMAELAAGKVPHEPRDLLLRLGADPNVSRSPAGQPTGAQPVEDISRLSAPAVSPEVIRIHAAQLDELFQSTSLLYGEADRQKVLAQDFASFCKQLEFLQQQCETILHSIQPAQTKVGQAPARELQRQIAEMVRSARRWRAGQSAGARALRLMSQQLERSVTRARMISAESVFEPFAPMVRELARSLGKDVEYSTEGLEQQADRLVLQTLKDAVMHALRNAVSHGIESPEDRRRAGKSPKGNIRLSMEVAGHDFVLRVEDDGRGLDFAAIRRRARELGLTAANPLHPLTDRETANLLFAPGFSTAEQITEVSGRGFGMSVVKEAAARLQGTARIEPRGLHGSILRLEIPLSAASQRVLFARAGAQTYAVPVKAIHRVARVSWGDVQMVEGKATLWWEGRSVLVGTLASVLRLPSPQAFVPDEKISMLVLSVDDREVMLAVDAMLHEASTLLRSLPAPANRSPFFSAGTVLEDGSVALVLNVPALLAPFRGEQLYATDTPREAPTPARSRVLVVDDSFTARTLQRNILEAAGFDVRVAVDGVAALAELKVDDFAIVVSDLQMPRMDGFELLQAIKADARLNHLPVVLVTSMNQDEDRARGLALGADAYIVKQKFDHEELLQVVQQLV